MLGALALGAVVTGAGALGLQRLRQRPSGSVREGSRPFEGLQGHKYVNLTTFRRSGEGVTTPVWFAVADDCIYITTPPQSGKMKRIGNNPRVVLTPCNAWGRPRGESVEGVGRSLKKG